MQNGYDLNDWSLCLVILILTGAVSRCIAFACLVTKQKKWLELSKSQISLSSALSEKFALGIGKKTTSAPPAGSGSVSPCVRLLGSRCMKPEGFHPRSNHQFCTGSLHFWNLKHPQEIRNGIHREISGKDSLARWLFRMFIPVPALFFSLVFFFFVLPDSQSLTRWGNWIVWIGNQVGFWYWLLNNCLLFFSLNLRFY